MADERSNGDDTDQRLRSRFVLTGILVLAALLRLFALDKGIWQDEYGSLRLISGEHLIATLRAHNHPPFYYLVLKGASLLAQDDSFLRLPSVLAGVAAVLCLWLWLARYSRFGATCAAVLAATHPFLVHYSQEMRSYGLLVFLTTLGFWLADELRRNWSDWRLATGLAAVLMIAIASHLIAVFVATAIFFYLGLFLLRERRWIPPPTLIPSLIAVPLTFLFFTKVFLTQVYDPSTWWMEPPGLALLSDIGRSYLGWPALAWFGGVLHDSLPLVPSELMALLPIALLVLVAIPTPRSADLPLPAAAVALALQFVLVSLLIVPVLVARTGLVTVVPVVAYIGMRLGRLRSRPARAVAVVTIGAMAAVFSCWWLLVEGRKPFGPWKEVAEILEPRLQTADLVLVSPLYAQGPLLHYLRRLPQQAVVAFQPRDSATVLPELRSRLAAPPSSGCRRVWQVVREDQNVRRWRDDLDRVHEELVRLAGEPSLVAQKGLVRITLYSPAGCREP